jgi:hypothetical protein
MTIVSFADQTGAYLTKLERLEQSLNGNFSGQFYGFKDYKEINCEPHKQIPYKFKPRSIQTAFERGSKVVLWCDSPVYAKKNVAPIFDHIKEHGYIFFDNIGYSLGDYTNDKTLNYFGISREQSWDIKMIMACVMGFDLSNPNIKAIFNEYYLLADTLYKGEWTNNFKTESEDLRCRGHRHDQSVMSCLIYKHGLKITHAQSTFFAYETHRLVMPIADSICLYSG